jgi:chorismate mutase
MPLGAVRTDITELDTAIIHLIAKRQELATRVAEIKKREGIPVHDGKRASEVLDAVAQQAKEHGLDPAAVRKIFEILIAMSEDLQKKQI